MNNLLTECEGRTGEYWPSVVALRTERSEVRTASIEGQYSPVRPSHLVSKRLLFFSKNASGRNPPNPESVWYFMILPANPGGIVGSFIHKFVCCL